MKNTVVIKKNYEFKNLFSKGKFYYSDFIYAYIKKNSTDINKFGIAISKKQGKAVERNRAKRLIRENYKNLENRIKKGYSFLIVINKNKKINEMNYHGINESFINILKKADLLIE